MEVTLRAFVAIKLPDPVISFAARLQDELKEHGLRFKWVKPRNLHLTLKFLGDIPQSEAVDVGAAMKATMADEAPIELALQGLGVFPGIKRPRVLWTGFGGQVDRLLSLQRVLEDQLADLGYKREKRGFKAHLTLARIKGAVAADRMLRAIEVVGAFSPQPFEARRLILYKSDLRPTGAVYTALEEVVLE